MSRVPKKETPPTNTLAASPIQRFTWAFLALIHVLAALLFFTNLTRNPYYTQIALLNAGIAVTGILWAADTWLRGELKWPRFPFEVPLAAFLAVALVSSVASWFTHTMLRPGILFETTRVWAFTLVNCVMALYLPGIFTRQVGIEPVRISIWTDILLALAWGALWFGFHANKDPDPTLLMWDAYGGFLWMLGCLYAVLRTRRGEAAEFFHVIFAVALLSGLYGLLQYAGKDIIWSSLVVPYGGRPVSSFGNPNFLSSYLMMVCPVALAFGLSSTGKDRAGYVLVSAVCALAVLCTLTRSSYIGLIAALLVMAFLLFPINQAAFLKYFAIGGAIFLAMLVIFPHTPISRVQSPLQRFTEIFDAMKSGHAYGPWHQRLLIWSSAWDMLQQNKILGKGWGCFELFYPYFQGKYLYVPILNEFRTHANNAHNILMEIWSQTGFLGAGMALWILVTILAGGIKIVKHESDGAGRYVSAALVGGIAGMVADNFFGNVSIFFATPAFLYWWWVGALFNESRKKSFDARALTPMLRSALALFGVFCLAATVYFVRRWRQEVFYFEGFKEAKVGDVEKSYKALEKAYESFPGEVNSNYEMGNSYARYGRMLGEKGLNDEAAKFQQRAIDAYVASLHANPGYDEIYFNLGVTQAAAGKKDEAARNLEIAMFINPLLLECYGALGNLYVQTGHIQDAIRVFNQGVETFPRDKDLWNNLGYCYSQVKDLKNSYRCYRTAVMIDPSFNQAWQNLSVASNALGEHNDPILQVPSLIRDMEALVAKKDFKQALGPAEKIAKILPDSADAHLTLGNINFYLGRKDQSENEFKRAIELRPNFVIARVNLGRLYQVNGRIEDARAKFKEALSIDPNDKEAKQALDSLPK